MAFTIHQNGDPVGVLSSLRFMSEKTAVVDRCLLLNVVEVRGFECSIEQDGKPLLDQVVVEDYDAGFSLEDPKTGERTAILERALITFG